MKNFLLLAAVAMSTVTASAQPSAMAKFKENQFKVAKVIPFETKKETRKIAEGQQFKDYSAIRQAIANNTAKPANIKGASQSSLYGSYIEASQDNWAECINTGQPTLSAYEDGKYTYVKIDGLLQGYASIIAQYDEATGKLDASGGQVCYDHATYGEMLLLSIHEGDDNNLYSDVTFTVNENGSITLDQEGLYIYMNEGEYEGQCWTAALYTTLYRPNGEAGGYFSSNSWNDLNEGPVYVEEMDDMITIYNFDTSDNHGGAITLFLNEDGTGEVPNRQMVGSGSSTTGDFYFNSVFVDDEGYLNEDLDEANSTPVIWGETASGNKVIYFGHETEEQIEAGEGKYTPAYNVVLSENGYWWGHWFYALKYQWTPDVTTGISDINKNVNPAQNKAYNLAGQQVSANAKGIVIMNGKKYLNK